MRKADLVWNRACSRPDALNLTGDRALADMLLAHGYAMNGGVLHAVEDLAPEELEAAVAGYRHFGLAAAADLIDEVRARLQSLTDAAVDRLEHEADNRYGEIASDETLMEAFERRYRDRPEEFESLGEADFPTPDLN